MVSFHLHVESIAAPRNEPSQVPVVVVGEVPDPESGVGLVSYPFRRLKDDLDLDGGARLVWTRSPRSATLDLPP
jgi:hypothetical protein